MTNNISNYFNNGSVFITGHVNPDGDALGAAFSLKLFLDSKNISADVNFDITTKLPSNLNHLPYNLISENLELNFITIPLTPASLINVFEPAPRIFTLVSTSFISFKKSISWSLLLGRKNISAGPPRLNQLYLDKSS